MTILAVCPYCKGTRVRAPRTALGASATCPRCRNCFTIVDDQPPPPPKGKKAPAPVRGPVTAAEIVLPESPPATLDSTTFEPEPSGSGFALAMIALIVAGLAFGMSQVPFGRIAMLVLGGIGIVIGLWALSIHDGERRWPLLGMTANAFVLLSATLLASWLGLDPWWPERVEDDTHRVKSIPHNGGGAMPLDGAWVDVSKGAWQQGDIRVTVQSARLSPIELTGPNDRHQWSKARYLAIELRIANVGVARRVDYRSWNEPPPPEAPAVAATAGGKPLKPATLPEGWWVIGRLTTADLFPGKTTDDLLLFDAPDGAFDNVHLELPTWAAATTEPVRIQIPRAMIAVR